MELMNEIAVEDVKAVVVETLGLDDRADTLEADTPLFGSVPELDSMAVLQLLVEFEQRFGIEIDGEDVTADAFETLDTLTAFVQRQLS
jgi:acyl carrier protein